MKPADSVPTSSNKKVGSKPLVAEALGVSEGAVSQWMNKAREGGKEALKTSPRPGRPPKLSEKQRAEELPPPFWRRPGAFRISGRGLDSKASQKGHQRGVGVEYDVSQVGRILSEIGWSRQKPDHRSDRRDEEAIETWKEEEWPRIKKSRD